jgi:hypothetical protein
VIAVAFRHVTGRGAWSRLIHTVAGPPVHCALVAWVPTLAAYAGWHATAGRGVEAITLTPTAIVAERWALVRVACDPLLALDFCARRAGSRYDYAGALLYGTPLTTRDRWTCSELCAEAVVAGGAPLSLLDAGRTPRRLLRALGARPSEA